MIGENPLSSGMTRRRVLQFAGVGFSATLLAACTPSAPAAPTAPVAPPAPTALPAAASSPAAPPAPSAAAGVNAVPSLVPSPSASPAGIASIQPLSARAPLKLMFTMAVFSLPLHVSMERGYFDRAGIDVTLTEERGSRNEILPLLARGDEQISEIGTSPALYNQVSQGFDIRVVASLGQEQPGRASTVWLWVPKERANEFRTLADLKGKTVEAGTNFGTSDLVAQQAVSQAGLTPGQDVTLSYRVKALPDWLTLTRANSADVYSIPDPIGTQVATQDGSIVKWKGLVDIMPWYQASLIGASSGFVASNRPTLQKFIEVYVAACREINQLNGQWTPDLAAISAKWGEVDPATITSLGGVPYYDPNATISLESLQRLQDFWLKGNQIQQTVDITQLVDSGPLNDALTRIGKA